MELMANAQRAARMRELFRTTPEEVEQFEAQLVLTAQFEIPNIYSFEGKRVLIVLFRYSPAEIDED